MPILIYKIDLSFCLFYKKIKRMELWMELLIYSTFICQCILGIIRIRHHDLSWGIVFIPLELFSLIVCIHKLYICNKKNEEQPFKTDALLRIEI